MKRIVQIALLVAVGLIAAETARHWLRHARCEAGLTGRYADLSPEDKASLVADCEAYR